MKVAVVGSRRPPITEEEFYSKLTDTLRDIQENYGENHVVLVSGGAEGIDTWSKKYAKKYGLDHVEFLPYFKLDRYEPFTPKHFFVRNRQIISNADYCVAFHDGESRGTADTISYSKKRLGEDKVYVKHMERS